MARPPELRIIIAPQHYTAGESEDDNHRSFDSERVVADPDRTPLIGCPGLAVIALENEYLASLSRVVWQLARTVAP
jgi:hypothetical protein